MIKRALLVAALTLACAAEGRAQTAAGGLRDLLAAGQSQVLTQEEAEVLLSVIRSQTTTFPLGSSAGGFTWTFDPQLKLDTLRTKSFGPMFAERAYTSGRGSFTITAALQRTAWQSLAGQRFDRGLIYNFDAGDEAERFETKFEYVTERLVLTATYGISDRVDIGVLVPVGRTRISGTSHFLRKLNTGRVTHDQTRAVDAESIGIGDIAARVKIGIVSRPSFTFSTAIEGRLPTSDEEHLIGAGKAAGKFSVIVGGRVGALEPHANIGYTRAGRGVGTIYADTPEPSNEIGYIAGTDIVAGSSLTFSFDVIGRTLLDNANFVHSRSATGKFESIILKEGSVRLLLGAVGAKLLLGRKWLLTTAVAFPLNDNGVKPGVTPVVGFERAF